MAYSSRSARRSPHAVREKYAGSIHPAHLESAELPENSLEKSASDSRRLPLKFSPCLADDGGYTLKPRAAKSAQFASAVGSQQFGRKMERCVVEGSIISCDSCERIWSMSTSFTLYAQQALESCPCPHCGAYTLACHDPAWRTAQNQEIRRLAKRRRAS
jgi:hypothetical protein